MKHLTITLLTLLFSMTTLGEVDLECEGSYTERGTIAGFSSGGTFAAGTFDSGQKKEIVFFSFDETNNSASIKIPFVIQPYELQRREVKDFIDVIDLVITNSKIEGKIKWPNKMMRSKVSVNRETGILNYAPSKSNYKSFRGECSLYEKKKKF